jgi:predicted metal-binding membrane protein
MWTVMMAAMMVPATAPMVLVFDRIQRHRRASDQAATPLKTACLLHCQSPMGFFLTRWREGRVTALAMGFRHGAYCVGCCWVLMGLLFVVGVMNLAWVAGLSAYVLLEKVGVVGATISRIVGVGLVGWGLHVGMAA